MPFAASGAIVAGAAALGSAYMQSSAAQDAADTQADATRESSATQKAMYDQTRADNMPALDARNASLDKMRTLLGIGSDKSAAGYGSLGGRINPGDVTNEAGYKFGLDQGLKTQQNVLGARGMRNSGAAIKAGARYGTDYATTKYDNAFNREVANRSAQLNPLQSLGGLAQTGASTVASAGQNYGNNVSANQTNLGNALGAGQIAQGNIWGGAVNQLVSAGNQNGWWKPNTSISGFNGDASSGYTNKEPWAVGPQQP